VLRRRLLLIVLGTSMLVLGACGGSGSGSAATTVSTQAPLSGAVTVDVTDNNFRPQDVTVTKGSTITWTNQGRAEHNIVAFGPTPFHVDTKSFPPGSSYSWVADATGTFRYYCSIHGTATAAMYGSVTVVEP
jgi:plastocyanin